MEPIQTLGGNKPISEMDMAELWDWLYVHPKFVAPYDDCPDFWNARDICLDVDYVRVNPETDSVDDDPAKNTQVQVWLEFGPLYFPNEETHGDNIPVDCHEPWASHDINLDCGGDTFEEAFRTLCGLVLKYYGDYERTGC